MPDACDIFGTAFEGGSATMLARIVGAGAVPIQPGDIGAIEYSVFKVWDEWERPVKGHAAVSLAAGDVLFASLQTDAAWTVDAVGYNFRHALDVATHAAFAWRGAHLVEYKLTPVVGQVLIVRFAIRVI